MDEETIREGRSKFRPLFRIFRAPKLLRYYEPFKAYKRGNKAEVEKLTLSVREFSRRCNPR